MRELIALDLQGGSTFVEQLQRAWDSGDAIFPVDQRLPPAAKQALIERFGATAVVDAIGVRTSLDGRPVDDGDAVVVATSGSTDHPKGVVLTHDAIAASANATSKRLGVTASDHWLACLPLSHVGGLSVVCRALHAGTRLTVLPAFDADAVEQSGANFVSLVPTALARIDATKFTTIVLGGSRPPDERPPNTVTTYGMTETGSGVVYDRSPLDGVEVRIVNGEIQLRCPMLLRQYRDGAQPFTTDGWYPTGDLGSIDDNGLLTVHGRSDDLIITGGENVWPEQVEAALADHPGIADLAVYGEPDDEWGEVVSIAVVPSDATNPPRLEELRDQVKATLPAFCAPKRISVVDALPRTAIGKLRRGLLSDHPR